MGTLHAWESFGDGEAPDIQAVAKGLGGGQVNDSLSSMHHVERSLVGTLDMPPSVQF